MVAFFSFLQLDTLFAEIQFAVKIFKARRPPCWRKKSLTRSSAKKLKMEHCQYFHKLLTWEKFLVCAFFLPSANVREFLYIHITASSSPWELWKMFWKVEKKVQWKSEGKFSTLIHLPEYFCYFLVTLRYTFTRKTTASSRDIPQSKLIRYIIKFHQKRPKTSSSFSLQFIPSSMV